MCLLRNCRRLRGKFEKVIFFDTLQQFEILAHLYLLIPQFLPAAIDASVVFVESVDTETRGTRIVWPTSSRSTSAMSGFSFRICLIVLPLYAPKVRRMICRNVSPCWTMTVSVSASSLKRESCSASELESPAA